MAVISGMDLESNFGDRLAGKPPATLERFYAKATQYLRKEETRCFRKKNVMGSNGEGVGVTLQ